MTMTVGQLIKELRRYPNDQKVAFASHDVTDNMIDGLVRRIEVLEDCPEPDGTHPFKQYGAIPVIRG